MTTARQCNRKIEAVDRRGERTRTFARPDGSFELEVSATPQRVRRGDGSWAAIDPTLRRGADGRIAPVATGLAMSLSGGGTGPLVTAQTAAGAWSMTWPTALPVPSLVGDTAVYADVRPGVDLHLRATPTGFGYVLVVRTRAAQADPALRRIAVRVSGPSLRSRADGGVEAVGPTGSPVLTTGGASMWDSSGPTVDTALRGASERAGVLSSARGPGDHARLAAVGVRVDGDELVLVPDTAMLADPRVALPLYLDPQFSTGYGRWAYANSSNSNNNDGIARVGLSPEGSGTYRSFFEFPISQIAGTRVIAATFQSVLVHSWSCGSTPVSLYWTGPIAAGVNGTRTGWSPGLIQWLDEQSNHAHKPSTGSGCAGDPQPDVWMYFGNQLAGAAQGWANSWASSVTLGLSARNASGSNETSTNLWKKFAPWTTSLIVQYNSWPGTPPDSALSTVGTSQTVPCYTGAVAGQPRLSATNGVQFAATLTDNDAGQNIVARFEWQNVTAGTAVVTVPDTPAFPSNHTFTMSLPASSVPDGQSIRWRVHGYDGTDNGGTSGWCQFAVDNATPGQPTITAADAPPFPANPPATTVVGTPVAMTVTPAPGDTDVVGYYFGTGAVDTVPTIWTPAASSGSALIPVVPTVSGLNKNFLTVVAVDAAGNRSPVPISAPNAPGTRQFRALAATPPGVTHDVTGDNKSDIVAAYDAGNDQTKLLNFVSKSDGSTVFNPTTPILTDAGAFPSSRINPLTGDVNGDGRGDVVAFRDDGGCRTTIWWWVSTGNGYAPSNAPPYDSGAGGWCYANGIKAVVGDYNGDGKDDVGAFYNYGGGRVALWVWLTKADGTGIAGWSIWWDSGPGNWDYTHIKNVAGDFTGDGKDDIVQLYDYNGCTTAIFLYTSTGTSITWPGQPWKSSPGYWCWSSTTELLAGDLNGDGYDDLNLLYDYGSATWRLWTWNGPGLSSGVETGNNSGPSHATALKAIVGDFNGDGRDDVGHFYNSGSNRTTLWILYSTGTAFTGENARWDALTAGGLDWNRLNPL